MNQLLEGIDTRGCDEALEKLVNIAQRLIKDDVVSISFEEEGDSLVLLLSRCISDNEELKSVHRTIDAIVNLFESTYDGPPLPFELEVRARWLV